MTDILKNEILAFDPAETVKTIVDGIRGHLRHIRKRGLIIAVSGGIDSSVSAALCVEAIGTKKNYALLLPETDSSAASVNLGETLVTHLGMEYEIQNIASTLEAIGCYRWRDEAIRKIFPDYTAQWTNKIAIAGGRDGIVNHFKLVVRSPEGEQFEEKMRLKEYLQIVAATNFKQRVRKNVEYFHADRLNYAVIGTPNRMEYDQGFFVKNGDGAADIKPIAHLYKSQVYALATYLGLPSEICAAQPSTDTYSMEQGQDEFYYALPYQQMDVALWLYNQGRPAAELAEYLSINEERALLIYKDIENKRRTTAPLHWQPLLIEPVIGPMTAPI
ncbi:MAG: NAD(+) synthase [Pseudomonadales bacterium]|nr:NAD(+) synthase [Pseudomonadales bacterium]